MPGSAPTARVLVPPGPRHLLHPRARRPPAECWVPSSRGTCCPRLLPRSGRPPCAACLPLRPGSDLGRPRATGGRRVLRLRPRPLPRRSSRHPKKGRLAKTRPTLRLVVPRRVQPCSGRARLRSCCRRAMGRWPPGPAPIRNASRPRTDFRFRGANIPGRAVGPPRRSPRRRLSPVPSSANGSSGGTASLRAGPELASTRARRFLPHLLLRRRSIC